MKFQRIDIRHWLHFCRYLRRENLFAVKLGTDSTAAADDFAQLFSAAGI